MTTEVAVKRGRGRPRKVVAESNLQTLSPEQRIVMQAQAMQALAQATEALKRLGIDVSQIAAPPEETTLERDTPVPAGFVEPAEFAAPVRPAEEAGKLRPGQKIGEGLGATWVPWSKKDLDPNDKVLVVAEAVPGLLYPATDSKGRQKVLVDVNGLQCWMTVGVPQEINRFFFNAYQDAYNHWLASEELRREGPSGASWGDKDGKNTWRVTDAAPSFGINEDGRFHPNPNSNLSLGVVPNRPAQADLAPKE